MREKLFLCLFFGLIIIISNISEVSATQITKERLRIFIRGELSKYFDGNRTLLTTDELRSLINFYTNIRSHTDPVNMSNSQLPLSVQEIIIMTIEAQNNINNQTPSGGNQTMIQQIGLLNGRDIGDYCETDYICASRNCSIWGKCSFNSIMQSGNMKNYRERCTQNEECKTGRCEYGVCAAKPCVVNEHCANRVCHSYIFGGIQERRTKKECKYSADIDPRGY